MRALGANGWKQTLYCKEHTPFQQKKTYISLPSRPVASAEVSNALLQLYRTFSLSIAWPTPISACNYNHPYFVVYAHRVFLHFQGEVSVRTLGALDVDGRTKTHYCLEHTYIPFQQ